MDPTLYPTLTDGSRTDRAVRLLTDLITSGRLAPGDPLPSEPALGKQLGISRPTVRLALRTLETRGLIATRHGVGAVVADRTREAAVDSIELMLQQTGAGPRDVLEVRSMLEGHGAALAAERATEADLAAIADAVEGMRAPDLTVPELIELDLAFHIRLNEASQNTVLVALGHAIRGLLRATIAATYDRDPRPAARLDEHARILAAVAAHDPATAQDAMAVHLHNAANRPTMTSPPRTPDRAHTETEAESTATTV